MAIDAIDWRVIFLLPLPFCLVAMTAGLFVMPERQSKEAPPPFDWLGYGLLSLSLMLLMSAAANGIRWSWGSDRTVLTALAGAFCGCYFVAWQLRSSAPLLDFKLWRNQRFSVALCVAFVFGAGVFAIGYVIPVFAQTVQGYSATQAGLVTLPSGILLVLALPITGRFADRVPAYVAIMIGLLCFALGAGLMSSADVNTPFWTFALFACISQFGLAFIMPSLSVSALSTLPPEQLARGSGNVNFVRQLGGAVGTNLTVVWLQLRSEFHADGLIATQTDNNETSREFLSSVTTQLSYAGIPVSLQQPIALDYLAQVVEAQALTLGFKDAFLALCVLFLLALLPTWMYARASVR